MDKKYNIEYLKSKVFEKYGTEYEVLSKEFNSYDEKFLVRHLCGNIFYADTMHFFGNNPTKCKCIKEKERYKKNLEKAKSQILNNSLGDGKDYELLTYTKSTEASEFLYKPTNFKFKMTVNHFLSGRRPKKLTKFHPNKIWSIERIKKTMYNLVGDEYTLVSQPTGITDNFLIRHNSEICNNSEFYMRGVDFFGNQNKKGQRCPYCSGRRKNNNVILNKLNSKFKNFKAISIDTKDNKVLLEHVSCGKTFTRNLNYIKGTTMDESIMICPYCNVHSRANLLTKDLLTEKNIKFVSEKNLDKENPYLRYDFQIFRSDGTFILLENDGIQHKEKIEFFDNKDSFEKRQERDQMKNEFADKNNITLIRIDIPKHFNKNDQIEFLKKLNSIIDHYKLL